MSVRSLWSGYLSIGIITIPVKVYSAIDKSNDGYKFNILHKDCNNRINEVTVCKTCDENKHLTTAETIKGYQYEPGKFITVSPDEFAAIKVPSDKTIKVREFIERDELDPLLIDCAYFIAPDAKAGVSIPAFGTIHDAIGTKYAIGNLSWYSKDVVVAIGKRGNGLVMYVLNNPNCIKSVEDLPNLKVKIATKAEEVVLAAELFENMAVEDIDWDDYPREYQNAMKRMIERKVKLAQGLEVADESDEQSTNGAAPTSNIMDALKATISVVKKAPKKKKAPAKPKRHK